MSNLDTDTDNARSAQTKSSRDYYVYLLVGITETQLSLATLKEYVLTAWQSGGQTDSCLPSQRLLLRLEEQFGLKISHLDEARFISGCLQSMINKFNVWHLQMQPQNRHPSVTENGLEIKDDISTGANENCNNNNTSFHNINTTVTDESETTLCNVNPVLSSQEDDKTGHQSENKIKNDLEKRVKELQLQIESQKEQISSLFKTNQNYKDDYQNKLRTLKRNISRQMTARDLPGVETTEERSPNQKPGSKLQEKMRYRVASLESQLAEKKREIRTLKHVVSHNRWSAEHKLKKLQGDFDEFVESSKLLTKSVCLEQTSMRTCEDDWKEVEDLQKKLVPIENENKNLRRLLSQEVTQKLRLLSKVDKNSVNRRHSLPLKVENELSLSSLNNLFTSTRGFAYIT